MDAIFYGINASWHWLGPLLFGASLAMLIEFLIIEVISAAQKDISEWH